MSFLGGVSDWFGRAASYASQKAETVKNISKEDVVIVAKKVSDASINVLLQIKCSCLDWAIFAEPEPEGDGVEAEEEVVEEGRPVGESEVEPGWEQVQKPQDELLDPYPAANAGVKRRKKKSDD